MSVTEVKSENKTESFFKRSQENLFKAHLVRTGLYVLILVSFGIYQMANPHFINIDFVLPVMSLFAALFFWSAIYLINFNKLSKNKLVNASFFVFDAIAATTLIYFSGSKGSLFAFIYLLNIILCGVVYNRGAAFALASLSALLFNSLYILSPVVEGSLFISLVTNNLAFFVVAYLSGTLGEQIALMKTEIKVKAKKIESLEDLNKLIVENVSSGLITITPFGDIEFGNRVAHKLFSSIQIKGQKIEALLPGIYDQIRNSDQDGKTVRRYECKLKQDQNDQTIEVIVSDLREEDKSLKGYVLLLQDLTQIKRLEFAARQQEKLAAVGQLAAGIAHEIRNPLASISGSVQLLAGEDASKEDNLKLMNIILKEIDRLNGLISEFLEFVRPDNLIEDPINVNSLIEEVLEMLRVNIRLNKNVDQAIELDAKSTIKGDYSKLKQAFLNISINSYQAMDKLEQGTFEVKTFDEKGKLVVLLSDTGVGMSEEVKQRIFEPFHTTKHNGTGLGLAITNKILENHNANVFVHSTPGDGTTFRLEFPSVLDGDDKTINLKYA